MKFIDQGRVLEQFSVSRKTLWRWRHYLGFPQPYKVEGTGKNLWSAKEVDEWAREKMQKTA